MEKESFVFYKSFFENAASFPCFEHRKNLRAQTSALQSAACSFEHAASVSIYSSSSSAKPLPTVFCSESHGEMVISFVITFPAVEASTR